MLTKVIFTHIPKTAGTSFMRGFVDPNLSPEEVYHFSGFQSWICDTQDGYKMITGHAPYGIHRFKKWEPLYITFLRSPVERCISYYYFLKDCPKHVWDDPDRAYADRLPIDQFYRVSHLRNVQTRYLAGILAYKVPMFGNTKLALYLAKRNLRSQYRRFGLVERFDESVGRFKELLGWAEYVDPLGSNQKQVIHGISRSPAHQPDNSTVQAQRHGE